MRLYHGDCLEMIKQVPDKSIDLVLTDPPYNIGIAEWDKIDKYADWCMKWIDECARVLKDNGSMYIWHNDMPQIAELMERIRQSGRLRYISFCIWDKGEGYRCQTWKQRDPGGKAPLRSWFNRCEYCIEYAKSGDNPAHDTGAQRINSNPACYKPLKEWYAAEVERLGLSAEQIKKTYTEQTGKKPHMLRHYFQDSQFLLPTCEVWEAVYIPLGFAKSYEELRAEYEELRAEYEELRYYHRCDEGHCNMWRRDVLQAVQKEGGHPCEKPIDLLRRIIRTSCRPGGTVLDLFMGGGSTGIAAMREGREFVGIERDDHWFATAARRMENERTRPKQLNMLEEMEAG